MREQYEKQLRENHGPLVEDELVEGNCQKPGDCGPNEEYKFFSQPRHGCVGKCVPKKKLKESGTAPDGGKRVAAARKKCVDGGKWWDAKEVSKPGGIFKACKDKSEKPK